MGVGMELCDTIDGMPAALSCIRTGRYPIQHHPIALLTLQNDDGSFSQSDKLDGVLRVENLSISMIRIALSTLLFGKSATDEQKRCDSRGECTTVTSLLVVHCNVTLLFDCRGHTKYMYVCTISSS